MALEYFDGFDDYSLAQTNRYWTTVNTSGMTIPSNGRNSGKSLRISADGSGRFTRTLSNSFATVSVGFAFQTSGFTASGNNGASALVTFFDGVASNNQVTIGVDTTGHLFACRGDTGGTRLGTTVLSLTTSVFYYIEVLVTISATVGVVTINVNGVAWLSLTSQNTKNTANTTINALFFNCYSNGNSQGLGQNNTIDYDDLYIDNAGTFYGDCRVETKLPTGNGTSSQFTPSAGTNWQNVDENPATDDTDYNSDGTAGHIDGYTYPALTTSAGNIKAVMTVPIMRNDAAGNVTAASLYRSGGTNYFGTTNTVGSTTYNSYIDIQATDPNTSAAWTVANVNACEFGIKRVA